MLWNENTTPTSAETIDQLRIENEKKVKKYRVCLFLVLLSWLVLITIIFPSSLIVTNGFFGVFSSTKFIAYIFGLIPSVFLFGHFASKSEYYLKLEVGYQYVVGDDELSIPGNIDLTKAEFRKYFESLKSIGRKVTYSELNAMIEYQKNKYGPIKSNPVVDLIYGGFPSTYLSLHI